MNVRNYQDRMAVEAAQKVARDKRIAEIASQIQRDHREMATHDVADAAAITYRRERLVGLLAEATPFSRAYEENSKEIASCESYMHYINPNLVSVRSERLRGRRF